MDDFNIIIGQPLSDGAVIVLDGDRAMLARCDNDHDATVYSRGVQDGYRAAKARLGNAYVRHDPRLPGAGE